MRILKFVPSIFTKRVLAACIVCALSNPAFALSRPCSGVFTNHAGHAVSGVLSSVSNGYVVIGKRRYPLSVFPERERTRMHELLNVARPLPPELLLRFKSLRTRYLRNEALLESGAKSMEDAESQRRRLESAWRKAVENHPELDGPMRQKAHALFSGIRQK
jgi:hypothetical protein